MGIGTAVKTARESAGVSRDELARKTGLTVRTIFRIEADQNWSRGSVALIANALDVPPDDLLIHAENGRRVLNAPGEVTGNDQAHPQVSDLDGVGSTKKEHNSAHHTKRRR